MRYRLEIISNSMSEMAAKTRNTFMDLAKNDELLERIESKGIPSCWFTREANIYSFLSDEEKEEEEEEYSEELENLRKENDGLKKKLKVAIDSLSSIAFLDEPDADKIEYWLRDERSKNEETLALDTFIARKALEEINGADK